MAERRFCDSSRPTAAGDPAAADLNEGAFDRRPGDAVRRFLLARIAAMRGEGMIESFAIDVLGVRRQMCLYRSRQIIVRSIWHSFYLLRPAKHRRRCETRAARVSQAALRAANHDWLTPPAAQSARRSGLLDRDLLLAFLRLRRLRQRDGEHAVLEICLDLVGIDAVRHAERALERAIATFGKIIVLLLLFLVVALLARDGQGAVGKLDVDVALIHSRQLRRDLVGFLLLGDIDGWRLAPSGLARPERLQYECAAAEWRAPGAQLEILEQAVDLAPQVLERPPLCRTIGALVFVSHGQFGCSFSHVTSPYCDNNPSCAELPPFWQPCFDLGQESRAVFSGSLAPIGDGDFRCGEVTFCWQLQSRWRCRAAAPQRRRSDSRAAGSPLPSGSAANVTPWKSSSALSQPACAPFCRGRSRYRPRSTRRITRCPTSCCNPTSRPTSSPTSSRFAESACDTRVRRHADYSMTCSSRTSSSGVMFARSVSS